MPFQISSKMMNQFDSNSGGEIKMNKREHIHLFLNNIMLSIITFLSMLSGFILSYLAEPYEQEIGYGTILSYNRDFLVDGRWWFIGGALISLGIVFWAVHKMSKIE